MSSPLNTKLQAYLLIYDPTRLLSLLYSKYGDIEEDENLLYINQLLYNKSSQFNILFKEYQYNDLINEYLKRFYYFQESKNRIPKLNEYYKNYHQFFCKPIFSNFNISKIMHSFCDKKAEIFYRNNYMSLNEEEKSFSESSLSSLDNLTNNKIIFSKNTRFLIDNNENSSKCTLNLDSSRTLKSNLNLLTKRSKDDSFINNVNPIVNFNEDIETKKKANKLNKKMYPKTYRKKKLNLKNNIVEKEKTKEGNIKSSLYSLVKNNLNCKVMKNKKNVIASPKIKPFLSYYKSNIDEFKKNKPKKIKEKINKETEKIKNKTYNNNSITNHLNHINSNFRNFSKLSATLNNNLNNNINISNTNLTTTNNKNSLNNNSKLNKNKISKINNNNQSNNNTSNNTTQIKNNKKEIKKFNSVNSLTKFYSNSNISHFNNPNQNTMRNLKKNNYGSNFTLVKTPLNVVQSNNKEKSINKETKFKKNKTFNVNISKNKNLNNKNSFSKKETKKNSKEKKNNTIQRITNKSYSNSINLNNLIFSSQRSTSNTSNTNILSPKNGINSNRLIINIKNFHNNSRNNNNMITHTQTNFKTFRKEISLNNTKSIDEEKIQLKNILFNLNNKEHNYQMSQRIVNQIEDLLQKSKMSYFKYNNEVKENINKNNCNEKEKISKISINDNNNCNIKSKNGICKKHINVNLNLKMKIDHENKKEKIIKVSPNK